MDSFFVFEFEITFIVFPNGSGAAQDKILPQVFKYRIVSSFDNEGLDFLKKFPNHMGEDKKPEQLRPFLFSEQNLSPS